MKKEKKFKLFDMNRDGKGVFEIEDRKPTLKFFFKLLARKFSALLRLNLMMLFQFLPIIAVVYIYLAGEKTQSATNMIFAPLYGMGKILPDAVLNPALDLSSIQMDIPVTSPVVNIIIIILGLFLAVTYGWQNVGATYVLRGLFRGDPVFIWSDYFYAIKKNFKQAFFMGLIDFAATVILVVDFIYFYYKTGVSFGTDLMYFMIFALILIYLCMRFYIYLMLVTFDLSIMKILKNALIFTALGIKRNIMGLIGLVILWGLHLGLILVTVPMGFSIAIIIPLCYAMAVAGFITTYAAYPIIDKYMIAPWKAEEPEGLIEEEE